MWIEGHRIEPAKKEEFMTRIFVDDREIESQKGNSSMSQILKYVEDSHMAQNSAVWQIRINGLPLIPNRFSEGGDCTAPSAINASDKVEIFTGTRAEIVRHSIAEALDYVDRIESATPYLVKSFRANSTPESSKALRHLYEGLYWWNLLLGKLKVDFLDASEDTSAWKGFKSDCHQKLVSILKRLIESQEKGNFVRVADLLKGEIIPLIPIWRGMLSAVAQRVDVTH